MKEQTKKNEPKKIDFVDDEKIHKALLKGKPSPYWFKLMGKMQPEVLPVWKNQFNVKNFPKDAERNVLPSLAVPDQSLTIQEIIKRHTRGIPIFLHNNGQFQDGPDPLNGRDINSLDIEEVWQIAENARTRYKQAQEKFMAEEEQKRQDRVKAEWLKEHEKHQQKLNQGATVLETNPPKDQSTNQS